jgi:GDP-4-dehydro-6-deoxy-D-mannose reductase
LSRKAAGFTLKDGPILVTGAGGFVGRRLMDMFQLGDGDIAADSTEDFYAPPGVKRIQWELPGPPSSFPGEVQYVVHLAGLSSVAHSMSDADKVMKVNAGGTHSVAQWVREYSPGAVFLLASSAEVYHPSEEILTENSLIKPGNPYGKSKLEAEKLLASAGIHHVISRSFPHFGPGQAGHFVLPSFCRRIIRSGESAEISTGNLTAVRDYLYIDDVVTAYACLLAEGISGEVYNVCSGNGLSIGDLLSLIISISGAEYRAVTDPGLLRKQDQFRQVGSSEKLRSLGWTQKIPIEKGLKMLYQWWEERL